jgi:hypothetical protein
VGVCCLLICRHGKSNPGIELRQINATGKSLRIFRNRVKPRNQKYFASRPTQIRCISPDVPFPLEGRIAIVTDVGDGMRWTRERQARMAIAGRDEPRERWAARRMIGAFAYGEAVSFWHPLLVLNSRRQSRPNRAGQTLIRGRRWQKGTRRRGERGVSRKTIACGNAGRFR